MPFQSGLNGVVLQNNQNFPPYTQLAFPFSGLLLILKGNKNSIQMKTIFLLAAAKTIPSPSMDTFAAPGLIWVAASITAISFLLGVWQMVKYFNEASRIDLEGMHLEEI
jgi:ABC-type amino acid transport system permease subunit